MAGGGGAMAAKVYRLPAIVAMRFNPDLKAKYQDLRKAGKPAKLAITTLMRKLIELAITLVRNDRKWMPRGGLIKMDTLRGRPARLNRSPFDTTRPARVKDAGFGPVRTRSAGAPR